MKWVTVIGSVLFYCSLGQGSLLDLPFLSLIGSLGQRELPAQSCQIKLYTNTPRYFTCSGTVIGKNQFVTAAHCGYGESITRAKIFCPGEPPVSVAGISRHPSYRKPTSHTIDCAIAPYDVAVVTTRTPFSVEPMKIPANAEEATHLLDAPTDCRVYGYGRDRNGRTGTHGGAEAKIADWVVGRITYTEDNRVVRTEEVKKRLNCDALAHFPGKIIQGGDSGGALVCKDPRGNPILAGVNQGINAEKEDNIVATFAKSLDWVKDQLGGGRHTPRVPTVASAVGAGGDPHARARPPRPEADAH